MIGSLLGDIGGIRDVLTATEQVHCILLKCGRKLSSLRVHRIPLGQYGRKRAETEFNWGDHVRRFVEIMDSIA